jgi:exosome complex RNA-binding protein Csl4
MTVQVDDLVESYSTPENCYFSAVRGRVISVNETHATVKVSEVIGPDDIIWQPRAGAFVVSLVLQKIELCG